MLPCFGDDMCFLCSGLGSIHLPKSSGSFKGNLTRSCMSAAPWLQRGVLSLGRHRGSVCGAAGCEQDCQSALGKGLATVLSSRGSGGLWEDRKDVCSE